MTDYLKKDLFGDTQELLGFRADSPIQKIFTKESGSWVRMNASDFSRLTIESLLSGETRLLVEAIVHKENVLFVTHAKDKEALAEKYPGVVIISVLDIFRFFSESFTDERRETFNTVLLAMSIFEGSRIAS